LVPQPGCDFQTCIASAATLSDLVWTNVDRDFKARTAGSWFLLQAARFRILSTLGKSALFPSPHLASILHSLLLTILA
jgi:hypothetical protein